MAVRLEQTIYDAEDQSWTIKIHDSSWGGGSIGFDITAAKITYQTESRERFSAVMPSVADISFRIDGATLEAFVTAYIGAPEKQFRLEIRKGASLFWVGNIIADNVRKQDKERPYIFAMRATDGLAALKDIDYNNAGTDYSGRARCTAHIINALNKIGTDDLFSTAILSTAVTWYSAEHSSTSVDPIHESRFDHRRYIKIDSSGDKSYYSCYEVIKSVCEAYGARIFLSDGTFKVVQLNEYEGANFALFNYDNTATLDSTTAAATYSKTDATDVIRLAGGNFEYYPALNKTVVNYTHFQSQSVIPGNGITTSDYTGPDIDSGGGTDRLLFRFDYSYLAEFTDPADFKALRFIIRLKVQIGSYFLTRTASVDTSTGTVNYSSVTWENSVNYFEIATPLVNENGVTQYATFSTYISPAIPEDGDIVIRGIFDRDFTASGGSISESYTQNVVFYNAYIETVAAGAVADRSNQFIYTVENDATNNSKKYEVDVELGDGPSANALGALQVYNGSGWEVSSGWDQGSTGGSIEIGQLLAQEILLTQAKPVPIINGTYNGFFSPLYAIYYGSEYYAASNCTIDLIGGKVQGSFFMCDSNGSAVTDKNKKAPFTPDGESLDISTPSGPTQEEEAPKTSPAIEASLIYKAKVTGTASDIDSGDSVTTIDIAEIGTDDVIRKDDVITVISVETGQTQSFTVTADVADTDTSISVSTQTASYDFAEGSIVTADTTEVLRNRKKRFRQRFVSHTSTTCTITENSGTLPTADYIDVTYNGQELDTADWSINGSDIDLAFTPNGLIVVKFWI